MTCELRDVRARGTALGGVTDGFEATGMFDGFRFLSKIFKWKWKKAAVKSGANQLINRYLYATNRK